MEVQLFVLSKGVSKFGVIKPVKNALHTKPKGGLFTSTFCPAGRFASEWVEWCSSEMPHWIKDRSALLLEVEPTARVYTINSYQDLEKLVRKYPYESRFKFLHFLDWEAISKDYDGTHLTSEGQQATRFSRLYTLHGWDCESALWFRNVFSKITPYKGKLVRD